MYVHRLGAGDPVVCVHGIGVTGRYFEPLARELARSHLVLVPDLPGWGRSERPRPALDIAELGAALVGLLDDEGIERAAIVANSLGCQVSTELAILAPERVSSLVLIGPTLDPYYRPWRRFVPGFAVDMLREPRSLLWIVAHDYVWMGLRTFVPTAIHARRHHIEQRLPLVTVPTLIVRGDKDGFVSQRWCEEAADLLPRGQVAVAHGAHAVNYGAPREVARLVESFIEEVEHGPGER